jgi:hypothetical protein
MLTALTTAVHHDAELARSASAAFHTVRPTSDKSSHFIPIAPSVAPVLRKEAAAAPVTVRETCARRA